MLKKLALAMALAMAAISCAYGQGQFQPGQVFGNPNAAAGQALPSSVSAILDRALGSTRGAIIERGAGGWVLVGPGSTSGVPWVSNGAGADPAYQVLGLVGGGTGLATATLNGIVYGNGTSPLGVTAAGTNGQLLLGVTASPPQMASMSQDCAITNAGVITCTKTNNVAFGPFATQAVPCTIAQGCTGQITQQAALNAIMCTPTRAGDHAYWNGSNWVCFAGNNSGTQVFSENSSGVPAWVSNSMTFGGQSVALGASATVQGNGAKIQLASGSTTSSDCPNYDANGNLTDSTIKCGTLSNAVLATGAAGLNPTGTTSNAGKMMGLGVSSCRITLTYSTRVMILISGNGTLATVGGQISANGYFADSGVTTAPANGAALTGTNFAANAVTIPSAGAFSFFVDQTILTGLTAGHTYWFDIGLFSDGTHTAAVQNTYCTAVEL